jgi:signal transduction histidine kinase
VKWRRSRSWLESKRRQNAAYIGVIAGCFALGMLIGWPPQIAFPFNNYFYGRMLRGQSLGDWVPQSVVVAIDEPTLNARGGTRNLRPILAEALTRIAAAHPKSVAIDVLLADKTDVGDDSQLEAALREVAPVLVLACSEVTVNGVRHWEDPIPQFKAIAARLGHVYSGENGSDGVNRHVQLEEIADRQRRWALALEAFSVAQLAPIIESPEDLRIGDIIIPAPRENGRAMYIRYLPSIPRVSAIRLDSAGDTLRGKTVFVGVTALAAGDRPTTTFGTEIPGVEMHAQIYETIAHRKFLIDARLFTVPLLCAALAVAAGLIFALLSGWQSYVLGGLLLVFAMGLPEQLFQRDIVFPFFAPTVVAWLSTIGAASFQYFFVQRELKRSESEKSRYQQAIHWAAHEMRTPLTAIQGSSEIMTRYSLPEDKRLQLSEMINSESKRLARLIQTFLDVERLAEGQMELKREPFPAAGVVETCLKRVQPIAERKRISVSLDNGVEGVLSGDRELMEYALYNLLTNAVKYSPPETEVHVVSDFRHGELRLSVRDQGIGMDSKELKSIFKKFYRTKKAEESGEVGTGIGLSIVEQIVTSEPGKGSCFTMIIAAHAETSDRRG